MKIGIVGTGISSMTAAHLLQDGNELTIFEANDYIGGHTHTIDVEREDERHAVDTGFIVFNDRTYPNFIKLLSKIGVESQDSEMSFSVSCDRSGLEYSGGNINGLFAQRSNLFRPSFHRMLRDIVRFNRESLETLALPNGTPGLGEYLRQRQYSREFMEHYIIPMGAAIWSAMPVEMEKFPVRHFVQFFKNHGLLQLKDRPQWKVIKGGSGRYMERLVNPFRDRIRLSSPVRSIRRNAESVEVTSGDGVTETFDHVVIGAHSDQALRMLVDATPEEREVLGAIPYQPNEVVLHTDPSLLPRNHRAWSSWNYHLSGENEKRASLTYSMNILQSLKSKRQYCVTMNRTAAIAAPEVIGSYLYDHPVYHPAGIKAQSRQDEINGVKRTWFCGAYWGYGFHEDGVKSALAVCRRFGREL